MAPREQPKVLPKPVSGEAAHQEQTAGTNNDDTMVNIPGLRNSLPSSGASSNERIRAFPPPPNLQNNPVEVNLHDTLVRGRPIIYNPPHCGLQGCRLPLGCDVVYDPWNDRHGSSRKDDHQQRPTKYISPFQRKDPLLSPKRRKISHDEDSVDEKSGDQENAPIEPLKPFSEKSWLAIEFFLLVRLHLSVNRRFADEIAIEALERLMPDIDYDECLAMDMLRLNHPGPSIYNDDDEDETTEGFKLHNLHMKVYHMEAHRVNPTIEALCDRLERAGYKHDHVLMRPLLDWDASEEEHPQDDELCNYKLVGSVNDDPIVFCPRDAKQDSSPENGILEQKYHDDKEQRSIVDRNVPRIDYLKRVALSEIRTEAAQDAYRAVWGLNEQNVQVGCVRLRYEREGKIWPASWPKPITDAHVQPEAFAVWVDNLPEKHFNFAKKHIDEWIDASVELNELISKYSPTGGTANQISDAAYSHAQSIPSSPKRKHPLDWPEVESIPSDSPPNWLEVEAQLVFTMTDDEALCRAIAESTRDSQPPMKVKQLGNPDPTVDELMDMQSDWALRMSMDSSLGEFPHGELLGHLLDQQNRRNMTFDGVSENSTRQQHHSTTETDKSSRSTKRDGDIFGLAGAEKRNEDITDRKARSRSPPKPSLPPYSSNEGRKMAEGRILHLAGYEHEVLPSIEQSAQDGGAEQPGSNKEKKYKDIVGCAVDNKASPNLFSLDSGRIRGDNPGTIDVRVLKADMDKGDEKMVDFEDGLEAANDRLLQFTREPVRLNPAEVLKSMKAQWLKEDEEYKAILRSDKSIADLLMHHDFPLTRRCQPVLEIVFREKSLAEWDEKREKMLASRRCDADADRHKGGSDFDGSVLSNGSNISAQTSADRFSDGTRVIVAVDKKADDGLLMDDGLTTKSHVTASVYAKRPSAYGAAGSSSAIYGNFSDGSMEQFPNHLGAAMFVEAPMPMADMGIGRETTVPEAPENEVVVGLVGGTDGDLSPNGEEVASQRADSIGELQQSLGEARIALIDDSVMTEPGSADLVLKKVPVVDLTEIKHSSLVKEA